MAKTAAEIVWDQITARLESLTADERQRHRDDAEKPRPERRQWGWKERHRLAEAQNWRCCWCGCEMIDWKNHSNTATIEHIIPISKGGADELDNIAIACNRCNSTRRA